jgi:hypothetical protein
LLSEHGRDLSTEEVEHIEMLATDLKDPSFETFRNILQELWQWNNEEFLPGRDSGQELEPFHNPKRSVFFLRAKGGPAFVRALGRHHTQFCELQNYKALAVVSIISTINEDVLSTFLETDDEPSQAIRFASRSYSLL